MKTKAYSVRLDQRLIEDVELYLLRPCRYSGRKRLKVKHRTLTDVVRQGLEQLIGAKKRYAKSRAARPRGPSAPLVIVEDLVTSSGREESE